MYDARVKPAVFALVYTLLAGGGALVSQMFLPGGGGFALGVLVGAVPGIYAMSRLGL